MRGTINAVSMAWSQVLLSPPQALQIFLTFFDSAFAIFSAAFCAASPGVPPESGHTVLPTLSFPEPGP